MHRHITILLSAKHNFQLLRVFPRPRRTRVERRFDRKEDFCDGEPVNPETLSTINNLAELYRDEGRYASAEPLFTKLLEGRSRVLGQENPDTLISVNNLGLQCLYQGKYARA